MNNLVVKYKHQMITEEEEKLFKEWAKDRPGFSPDGIIDENKYLASKPKIVFIFKEVNSKKGISVNLKAFLKSPTFERKQSWDNVARWIYGINHIDEEVKWQELEDRKFLKEIRRELLPTICVINLKKTPGRYVSDNKELQDTAEQDKLLLNRQFQLYFDNEKSRPDIIICGGSITAKLFSKHIKIKGLMNKKRTSRGICYQEYDNERFLIHFSHPEARIQDSLLFYGLIDAIREMKKIT